MKLGNIYSLIGLHKLVSDSVFSEFVIDYTRLQVFNKIKSDKV